MEEIEKIMLSPTAKDNGLMFVPPHGYEVEKADIVDGKVFVTLKAKEMQLPKTWEEFCKNNPVKKGEFFIHSSSNILACNHTTARTDGCKTTLPDRETAEAVLALCQLIQLRECYNKGWKLDWKNTEEIKYIIEFEEEKIATDVYRRYPVSPLFFKNEELRYLFLDNFSYLVEKMRPLYGIMKGGEE